MPKSAFTLDNVKSSGTDFPKVKLEQGAVWRVVIIEKEPTYAWTHRLQKPRFSAVTGEMLMREADRRNGEKVSIPDLDFVGSPACLGSLDVLGEKGVDSDHCPVCAMAMERSEQFSAPERRFAVHVLKYATKPGTSIITLPFSVETRVWVLSEKRFTKVTQVITEWGGDPTAVDLVLGPCVNVGFQNYEIAAGQVCEMRADSERLKRAVETFKESNAGDLEPYCGRISQASYLKNDIDDVVAAWAKAARGASPVAVDVSGTLDSSLLDSLSVFKPDVPVGEPLSALDDTVGEVSKPVVAAPVGEDITSFDDLLKGLA